jgi:hypothetical protein
MPDDEKIIATDADNKGEGEGQGSDQNKDAKDTNAGGEDANKGDDDKGEGEGEKDTSKGNEKAKAPQEGSQDDDKEPDVRKRLSKQDFIIGRQKAKLAKTQEKQDDDKDDEGDDDDVVAPEDEAMISKVVAKKFAPIIEKSLADDDNQEIASFLSENPDFKEFEAKARRYMQHPSRRQLPIKAIFYEVAGDKLIKIGAERQRLADEKAKNSQSGGGSNRGGEGSKSVWDLTPEEFAEQQERVRRGLA